MDRNARLHASDSDHCNHGKLCNSKEDIIKWKRLSEIWLLRVLDGSRKQKP
ncbi:hypothetical protein SAY87_024163 [Trapa incisa]|uniref:Uncharacterized protein n=1 Tax=Trapa incisa TaxID=236973 RepID=A0AAN7KZ12_9MYRT|nr:hypothetical protein SAY87_024163 [Trapa incisa]